MTVTLLPGVDPNEAALAALTGRTLRFASFRISTSPALLAAAGPGEVPWEAVVIQENAETGDGRFVESKALSWRDLPLTLSYQDTIPDGMNPHGGAVAVGRFETIERVPLGDDGTADILATGFFTADEDGVRAARDVESEKVTGVSADLDLIESRYELEIDDEGEIVGERYILSSGRIMGAIITPYPAFADARIRVTGPAEGDAVEADDAGGVAASAARLETRFALGGTKTNRFGVKVYRAAFANPQFETLTPFEVERCGDMPFGLVKGHVAPWGVCHVGIQHRCQTAPESKSQYAYFHLGAYACEDGPVAVGKLSLGGLHADRNVDMLSAQRHYEDVSTTAAYICAGEDDFGIWVAGVTVDALSEAQFEMLCAACPSGDWRPVGTNLEMIAVHEVNAPGFPVPRTLVASASFIDGEQVSFISGGVPRDMKCEDEDGTQYGMVQRTRPDPGYGAIMERLDRIEANQRAQMRWGLTIPDSLEVPPTLGELRGTGFISAMKPVRAPTLNLR